MAVVDPSRTRRASAVSDIFRLPTLESPAYHHDSDVAAQNRWRALIKNLRTASDPSSAADLFAWMQSFGELAGTQEYQQQQPGTQSSIHQRFARDIEWAIREGILDPAIRDKPSGFRQALPVLAMLASPVLGVTGALPAGGASAAAPGLAGKALGSMGPGLNLAPTLAAAGGGAAAAGATVAKPATGTVAGLSTSEKVLTAIGAANVAVQGAGYLQARKAEKELEAQAVAERERLAAIEAESRRAIPIASEEERRRARLSTIARTRRRGRAGTILTGGGGDALGA